MGKGLALEFKQRYPNMFERYKELCTAGELQIGQVGFYVNRNPRQIICLFPTKKHWRNPSSVTIIDASLLAFTKHVDNLKLQSVAFPMVGCGLGGLNFEHEVKPLMEMHLSPLPLQIQIYI